MSLNDAKAPRPDQGRPSDKLRSISVTSAGSVSDKSAGRASPPSLICQVDAVASGVLILLGEVESIQDYCLFLVNVLRCSRDSLGHGRQQSLRGRHSYVGVTPSSGLSEIALIDLHHR